MEGPLLTYKVIAHNVLHANAEPLYESTRWSFGFVRFSAAETD
jgi:hypothetical protein